MACELVAGGFGLQVGWGQRLSELAGGCDLDKRWLVDSRREVMAREGLVDQVRRWLAVAVMVTTHSGEQLRMVDGKVSRSR